MSIQSFLSLRNVLRVDAASCVATGLASIVGASKLSGALGLPEPLLEGAGISLLLFALLILYAAARVPGARWPAWLVVLGNTVWVLDSVLLMLSDTVAPTALGLGYIALQAGLVALLAELEFSGLRKLATTKRQAVVS
jgi:hypothetical protein